MSASTELLVEQIQLKEQAIVAAEGAKQDVTVLKAELRRLQRQLVAQTEALNEGATKVLKG